MKSDFSFRIGVVDENKPQSVSIPIDVGTQFHFQSGTHACDWHPEFSFHATFSPLVS